MTTNINFTAAAPVVVPMSSVRFVTASLLLGAGASMAGATDLRGTGASVALGAFAAAEAIAGGGERPIEASVAGTAWISGYASVANGAGHHPQASGGKAVTKHYPSKKRAFRGLEPWRDPA